MSERPRPEPLPLAAGPAGPRGGRRGVLAAVLGVVALALCGGLAAGAVVLSGVVGAGLRSSRAPVWDVVVFGGGRYLAVECVPEAGASVYVVDLETGDRKPAVGFELLAAEPHAPVLWLTRSSSDGGRPGEGSMQGDGSDAPQDELMVWNVDAESAPGPWKSGGWTPWPGDGGYSAFAEVEPVRGAWPASLDFRRLDGSGRPAQAVLPEGFGTFEPLGWSPSGRYFAVRELGEAPDSRISGRGRVVILDAADGSVASSFTPQATAYLVGSAWDSQADELGVVTVGKEATGAADTRKVDVTMLSADLAPNSVVSGTVPAVGAAGWRVMGAPGGIVLSARGSGAWRVAVGSLESVSAQAATGARCVGVLPDGDMLWHEPSPVSDRIVRTSADGTGDPVAVWTEEDTRNWRWPPE